MDDRYVSFSSSGTIRNRYTVGTRRIALTALSLDTVGVSLTPAQQTTGTPGSSSATTTINGKQLPPPDPTYGGVIKEKASDSTPWWPPRIVPPKGAPNVLLIMTDYVGYGAPGAFGGVVPIGKNGSHREQRITLHKFPLHITLLALAGGINHRAQSPRGGLWSGGRNRDRVPRL